MRWKLDIQRIKIFEQFLLVHAPGARIDYFNAPRNRNRLFNVSREDPNPSIHTNGNFEWASRAEVGEQEMLWIKKSMRTVP